MVKINFSPWKEVVIHEVTYYPDFSDLVNDHIRGAPVGTTSSPLLWAEGVVFLYNSIPAYTEPIARERLEGKIHWSNVIFARMEEQKEEIKSRGAITIPIVNVENNSVLREAAKWLGGYARSLEKGSQ